MKIKNGDIQIIDYSEFSEINEIGRGGHGTVYSAEYGGTKIAIKDLRHTDIRTIVNELKQHMTVNDNENFIRFLGIT
ncbi:5576_t:CDS:2, partial [Racocetra persica]